MEHQTEENISSPLYDKLLEVVASLLEGTDVFLVELLVRGKSSGNKVEVYLDSDTGITLDSCAKINRKLSYEIETNQLMSGNYKVDVSSPGRSRALLLPRQYKKFVGKELVLTVRTGEEVQKISGTLKAALEEKIEFSTVFTGQNTGRGFRPTEKSIHHGLFLEHFTDVLGSGTRQLLQSTTVEIPYKDIIKAKIKLPW